MTDVTGVCVCVSFTQVDFDSERNNPLAQVTLPGSLLTTVSLSEDDIASLSRITFMFFSSTSLFQVRPPTHTHTHRNNGRQASGVISCLRVLQKEQDGRSLISYVVASSVGNVSIRELKEPVVIEIVHLSEQVRLTGTFGSDD